MAAFPNNAAGRLTVDLNAIVVNWRRLSKDSNMDAIAAVVKADAYRLGAKQVVSVLQDAGCRHFFVAHLAEAIDIAALCGSESMLAILNGLCPGEEAECSAAGLVPVLSTIEQARRWMAEAERVGRRLPAIVQVDSGMSRLGLSAAEAAILAADSRCTETLNLRAVMSHLACADDPAASSNILQCDEFERLASLFPGVPRSLANSGGCLLPPRFHADIVRAGVALYGGNPAMGGHAPFAPVVRLEARILQVRIVPAGAGVGYGMAWRAAVPSRLATLNVGYADGWLRSLSGQGSAWHDGVRLPIVGRVSMDSMVVDLSALPHHALAEGDWVELIGPHQSLEDVARDAGTISYEILTSLGPRYGRFYLPAPAISTKGLAA